MKLEEPTYSGHFEVRRVRASGEIKRQGQHVFLSQVLKASDWNRCPQ